MPRLGFSRLLHIYRQMTFNAQGDRGTLTISDQQTLDDLRSIAIDEDLTEDTGLFPMEEVDDIVMGLSLTVKTSDPRHSLGFLFRDFDHFLMSSRVRIAEPQCYYIQSDQFSRGDRAFPAIYPKYAVMLKIVSILVDCASYLDELRHEIVYISEGKFALPVNYDTTTLRALSLSDANAFCSIFDNDIHREQKLTILAETVVQMTEAQPTGQRFSYLINNIKDLTEDVRNGYKLFASSFSYAKIRSEIESARVDYIGKIYKTIVDIQGQLLGIPVATVIVASQMKVARQCGSEFWTNIAVLSGAWAFVILLSIGVVNQAMTLASIGTEVNRQKGKLVSDYAAISKTLTGPFDDLRTRIRRHAVALSIIETVALVGAIGASIAYYKIDAVGILTCLQSAP